MDNMNLIDKRIDIPSLFGMKENCCGCSACYSVCSVSAISMVLDKEGFLYPEINTEKCIRCGKCTNVCAFKENQRSKGFLDEEPHVSLPQHEKKCGGDYEEPACYAVKHKDLKTRMASRSGGVFSALSDRTLERGGVVYGCILTENFDAVHMRAETCEDRDRMRGSKYIQSSLQDVFKKVKSDLDNGREVLFSGTSCQIAGVRSYLRRQYDNLLCVDIVCHGVPSPAVWHAFLDWQRKNNAEEIDTVDFRNKVNHGWNSHIESLYLKDGKRVDSEVFKELFYGHNILRPSCYRCPYKSVWLPGDITIADYWGIDKAAPGFSDNKGVSLVLIHNDRGAACFEEAKLDLEYRRTKLADSMQPPLIRPFSCPTQRAAFWEDFQKLDFDEIARRYGGYGMRSKIKRLVRKLGGRIKRAVLR